MEDIYCRPLSSRKFVRFLIFSFFYWKFWKEQAPHFEYGSDTCRRLHLRLEEADALIYCGEAKKYQIEKINREVAGYEGDGWPSIME